MDAFAGLDGLSSSSAKNLSLEEQRKQKENRTSQFNRDLDWLSAKPSTPASIPSFSPSITPQRTATASPAVSEASKVSQSSTGFEDDDVFGLFSSAPPKKTVTLTPQTAPRPPTTQNSNTHLSSALYSDNARSTNGGSGANSGASSGVTNGASRGTGGPNLGPKTTTHSAFKYDRQLAELTEMGFEASDGKRALVAMNGSVNGSVNWLMAEAQGMPLPVPKSSKSSLQKPFANAGFTDLSTQASQFTSSVFSKASNLFSKGRKELEKAYNQYQHPGTVSEPAWMRDKAKYDARRASPSPEPPSAPTLPSRPRYSEDVPPARQERTESPINGRAKAEPASSAPKSRAELFRQRQMQRQTSVSERAPPSESSVPISESLTPVSKNPVPVSESPVPEATPAKAAAAVDLLNLDTPVPDTELSSTSRDIYATSRELGTASFRNGDFESAIGHYTTAIQVLPSPHSLRTILLANRAAASLKAGNPREAFEDTLAGINALPTRGRNVRADDGTNMAEIWVKLVTRHAQAAEHMEKFSVALKAWEQLLNNGHASPSALEAKRRCLAALNPEKVAKASASRAEEPPKSRRRGWGTTGATPSSQAGKEALEKVKQQHTQQAAEERERDQLRDEISGRVDAWKHGNERDLRALLATLSNVLGQNFTWTPVAASELVVPRKVKIVYMKAVARTHPDKVPASAPVATKMIAQSVFVVLQTAWDVFRQENNL